jgi:hypothetical protein
LRARIAAPENAERTADQEEQGIEREQKRNAERIADLEKQNDNLNDKNYNLNGKAFQLQSEVCIRQLEVNRLVYKCEDCVSSTNSITKSWTT